MAKQLPVESVVCTECHQPVEAAPQLDLLGLYKFSCPHCSKTFRYPMSEARRRAYVVATVVFAVASVAYFVVTHAAPLPGVLPLAIALGLYRDQKVRNKVAGGADTDAADASTEDHETDPDMELFGELAPEPEVDSSPEPVYAGVSAAEVSAYAMAPPPPPAPAAAPVETSVPTGPSAAVEHPVDDSLSAMESHASEYEVVVPSSAPVRFDDVQHVEAEDTEPEQDLEPVMSGSSQVTYSGTGSWTLVTGSKRKAFRFRR
jgi:hypothetical protein